MRPCACYLCLRSRVFEEQVDAPLVDSIGDAIVGIGQDSNSGVSDSDRWLVSKLADEAISYLLSLLPRKPFIDRQRD